MMIKKLGFTLFALIMITLFSFSKSPLDDYKSLWDSVEKYEQERLPQSAFKVVEQIYAQAKKENNEIQIVKAMVYKASYTLQLNEDGFSQVVKLFKEEKAAHKGIAKALISSIEASIYQSYLQSNLYKINQRTGIDNTADLDPELWATQTFIERITDLHLSAIAEPKLKQGKVADYKELLNNYDKKYKEHLPTLYDVLLSRALGFLASDRTYLSSPSYKFTLDHQDYMAEANRFSTLGITTQDSSSLLYKAICLFQEHLTQNASKPIAHAEVNLNRLQLVNRLGKFENKEEIYIARLKQLRLAYRELPQYTEVLGKLAQAYYAKGQQLKHHDKDKSAMKIALEYCQEAIDKDPKAYGTRHCINIYNQIKRKNINIQLEQFLPIDQKGLGLLNYKNIDKVYFKIFRFTANEEETYNLTNRKEQLELIRAKKASTEWNVSLPNEGNFLVQTAEVSLPAQAPGRYAILLSDRENFFDGEGIGGISFYNVTNLTYSHQHFNSKPRVFVRHRVTGHPEAGVTIKRYISNYDSEKRKQVKTLEETVVTDRNGKADFKQSKNSRNYSLTLEKGVDRINTTNHHNYGRGYSDVRSATSVIFTDRALYRPGQQAFFKVLSLSHDENNIPKINAHKELELEFLDANYQRIGEIIKLRTNEYGSCNGSLNIPSTGLTGRMTIKIRNENSQKQISVEEYKRPKFNVEVLPLETVYQLNDTVTVDLKATSFAGAQISGADVIYSVSRQSHFPFYRWGRWGYPSYYDENMEIDHGTGVLDKDGKLSIAFKAIGDKRIDTKYKPVYHYKVSISVVDINGETQTANQIYRIGSQSVSVDLLLDAIVDQSDLEALEFNIQDLNGNDREGKGNIQVIELAAPSQTLNQRYWSFPDTILIGKEEFSNDFPWYDPSFSDQSLWPVKKEIVNQNFDTAEKGTTDALKNLNAGNYKVRITMQDLDGSEIEHIQYVTVYDFKNKDFPADQHVYSSLDKSSYQPGEKMNLNIGTADQDIKVLLRVEKRTGLVQERWIDLSEISKLSFDIKEEDRGGFTIHLSYFKNNRYFFDQHMVQVPWSNKNLEISYETFRDKLLPGSKEEFRIKISGPDKEKVSAEFLAGMYDASLDEILPHNWAYGFYNNYYARFGEEVYGYRAEYSYDFVRRENKSLSFKGGNKILPYLNLFRLNAYGYGYHGDFDNDVSIRGSRSDATNFYMDGVRVSKNKMRSAPESEAMQMDEVVVSSLPTKNVNALGIRSAGVSVVDEGANKKVPSIRKNLKETVFFYPDLKTDKDGNLILSFTMNEALTKWRLMSFAHTKDLKFAYDDREVVTQKKLMVVPNAPRFVRDGDFIRLQSKVTNLSEKTLSGTARLDLKDAITLAEVNTLLGVDPASQAFKLAPKETTVVTWSLRIPHRKIDALQYTISATAKDYSDAEQNVIPVVTNKILVTETLPITVKSNETKQFIFDRLANNNSASLVHKNLVFEYTNNPAWYAIQALPYVMEYPYACTEQIFNRYYANSLGSHIANANPAVKRVFDSWKMTDSEELVSNLSKNEELKTAILKDTPWVQDALSETEQKNRIALLFDFNKMANEKSRSLKQLVERQNPDGGFSWFPGPRSNRYISQYLLEGLGHLKKLGVLDDNEEMLRNLLPRLISYCDSQMLKDYNWLKRHGDLNKDNLTQILTHYLYTRSFYLEVPVEGRAQEAYKYYLTQAENHGLKRGIYSSGMLALALNRNDKRKAAIQIYNSLMERSLSSEELGRYWNEGNGYNWYELPIERHALMLEMVSEMGDKKYLDQLKLWLLRNKQTNNWKTTKATAAAIYALLIEGEDNGMSTWITSSKDPEIKVAGKTLSLESANAGTGYIKTNWQPEQINSKMAEIEITNQNDHLAWGSMYWQYFEDMDKVSAFDKTALKMQKSLYKVVHSDYGEKMEPLSNTSQVEVGDQVRVKIILESDRSMEYLHLKDMRASGLEPMSTLSGNRYAHGLYYYQSTRDLATDFFIHYLPKGKYVFEYDLRVQHSGSFSNGLATIQSMYAPEFTSHSEGLQLEVLPR